MARSGEGCTGVAYATETSACRCALLNVQAKDIDRLAESRAQIQAELSA
jgi:hypothetical protein